MNLMSSIVGCFVTNDGKLYKIIDVWIGDKQATAQVMLEHINGDNTTDFEWMDYDILKTMEVVSRDE